MLRVFVSKAGSITSVARSNVVKTTVRAASLTAKDSHHNHGETKATAVPFDQMPDIATGRELAEKTRKLSDFNYGFNGQDPFGREVLTGPFGTKKNPVVIPSFLPERTVACLGFKDNNHEVIWFNLHEGHMHRCGECGQAFTLKVVPEENPSDDHHH